MKRYRFLALLITIGLILGLTAPAYAQLGQTDNSSFTIQNVDTAQATVTVIFINNNGDQITPTALNSATPPKPNPFTLDPGASYEINVGNIPTSQLPSGAYSVEVESTAKVVAISNIIGSGSKYFNGSYTGFDSTQGANPIYLPSIVYNYYGWYSFVSVQNMDSSKTTDITVNITCDTGKTATLTQTGVKPGQAAHWALKSVTPTGLTSSDKCNGSGTASGTNSVTLGAVDMQSVPAAGNTQSYSGIPSGANTIYVPALYTAYYGWNASLNIRKITSGNVTATVTFTDSGSTTCSLTDAAPGCLVYVPGKHPTKGYFGATITTDTGNIVAVVNAANGSQAQTYNGIDPSAVTDKVGVPSVMKTYYGWNTSVTCQNLSTTTATQLHLVYQNQSGATRDTASVGAGKTLEISTTNEAALPAKYQGGLTVTSATAGVPIACIVNFNNATQMGSTSGDWSMSVNAFNQ